MGRTETRMSLRTFRSETRSAACSRVSPEMSSTIFVIFGSTGAEGGGGAGDASAAAAVARHLDELAKVLGLARAQVRGQVQRWQARRRTEPHDVSGQLPSKQMSTVSGRWWVRWAA